MADAWNPDQYERFKAERTAPFHDLLDLVAPVPAGAAVDLGCGTGELTAEAHARLRLRRTMGIDSSPAMLERAAAHTTHGLDFRRGDIAHFTEPATYDVVIANASLQWVPDHPSVLARWSGSLRPGGQLAVQVPANADHPSHVVSATLAGEAPFAEALGGAPPPDPVRSVLSPEAYATLLDELGFAEQHVRLQVYGHRLASTADVVEWVRGTSLTRFQRRLPPELFEHFVDRYRERLLAELGDRRPYFYAFKRILMWGRRP